LSVVCSVSLLIHIGGEAGSNWKTLTASNIQQVNLSETTVGRVSKSTYEVYS